MARVANSPEPLPLAWNAVFANARIGSPVLADAMFLLHEAKQYDRAVEGMLAALRNDHGQPWMYDVLALEMKLANRPQRQIDRVLLSRVDFTGGNAPAQMLIAASYMARFKAYDQAISICREVARRTPFQPAVWGLGRRIAQRSKNTDHIVWAFCGSLRHEWEDDYAVRHAEYREVLRDLEQQLADEGKSEDAVRVRTALEAAWRRDLKITMSWTGDADLDLLVYEPNGHRCSYKQRVTANGGALVKQSSGGKRNRSDVQREEYVLSTAPNGEYVARVRYISGRVIGGRVRLDVVQYANTPDEDKQVVTLPTGSKDPELKIQIKRGRARATDEF